MEHELYPHVQNWIDAEFHVVRPGARVVSHRKSLITANLDWIDGGAWMRPDLALLHVHRRRFDPTPSVDLYTFEVKPAGARALTGLHQTLAHGRIADFVVFVVPSDGGVTKEVHAQAARFGVGLVTFEDPKRWDSYKTLAAPQRMTPDLDLRDLFLSSALKASEALDEVLSWISGGESR